MIEQKKCSVGNQYNATVFVSRASTPEWVAHTVLSRRQSEDRHGDPAIWWKGGWHHPLVRLIGWLSEIRHCGEWVVAETMLRESCWAWLTYVMGVNPSRQKRAVTGRQQPRRMCKEHRQHLWTNNVVVRYSKFIWRLEIDRS